MTVVTVERQRPRVETTGGLLQDVPSRAAIRGIVAAVHCFCRQLFQTPGRPKISVTARRWLLYLRAQKGGRVVVLFQL